MTRGTTYVVKHEKYVCVMQVDAPRLFSGLWHMLQPVVDPHTKQKISFLPCALLLPLFPPSILELYSSAVIW